MERDEAGTWRRITRSLSLFRKLVPDYGGRIVNEPGDAVLALFRTATDALKFGVEVQCELRNEAVWGHGGRPLPFRIGINLGPVIEDGRRVYGHAINVAERIQRKASPGGICLSEAARHALEEEPGWHLRPLGRLSLEGIDERIEIFAVGENLPRPDTAPPPSLREPVLPGEASVAVLPLADASSDPTNEHLCAGITTDVISELTRFRDLLVIAPHSTFLFEGSGLPREEIADRLGVRYLVTGNLRRAGTRLRLHVQLSEARSGHVLWSERYDGEMGDMFAFEDEVAGTVAARLDIQISDAERRRLARLATPMLDAYGMVLRAQELTHRYRREANLHARRLFEQAAETDPGYGRPYAGVSRTWDEPAMLEHFRRVSRVEDGAYRHPRRRGHRLAGVARVHGWPRAEPTPDQGWVPRARHRHSAAPGPARRDTGPAQNRCLSRWYATTTLRGGSMSGSGSRSWERVDTSSSCDGPTSRPLSLELRTRVSFLVISNITEDTPPPPSSTKFRHSPNQTGGIGAGLGGPSELARLRHAHRLHAADRDSGGWEWLERAVISALLRLAEGTT